MKKITAILAAVLMATGLSACGDVADESSSGSRAEKGSTAAAQVSEDSEDSSDTEESEDDTEPVESSDPVADTGIIDDYGFEDMFSDSVTICGVTITADEVDYSDPKTGTELTDAAENLLKEMYGEEFTAYQYPYYDEFSLMVRFTACPVNDPDVVFGFDFDHKDPTPSHIVNCQYYSELLKEDINDYLYEQIADLGITDRESFDVQVSAYPFDTVKKEGFADKVVSINIIAPDEAAAEVIMDNMEEYGRRLYAAVESGQEVATRIYIGDMDHFYRMIHVFGSDEGVTVRS